MKVAHIVPYPPFQEGTGTVAYYLAKALSDLGVGIEVIVPELGRQEQGYDTRIYRYVPNVFSIQNAYLTPKLLSLKGFDIIHLHYPYIFGSELVLINSVFKKIPVVLTYHNDLIGNGVKGFLFDVYQKFFSPLILNRAEKITFNSFDHARSSIFTERIFNRKWDHLVEVPSGVDVKLFRPGLNSADIRKNFGYSEQDIVILFVSSLDRGHVNKGLFFLLKALSKLHSEENLKLLIVGDGEMREEYLERAAFLGITESVKFAGRVPHQELPRYLNAGDMIVIPAVAESFGLAIAEGMACGLPAIATDNPGVRMVIQDQDTGFLVPYNDVFALTEKICLLAKDPELRARMGKSGTERIVNNFSWEIAANKMLELYTEILGST